MISVVVWMWSDVPTVAPTVTKINEIDRNTVSIDAYKTLERKRNLADRYPNRPELRQQYENYLRSFQRTAREPGATKKVTPPRSFLPEHVNVAQQMFARHLTVPHRFICISDDNTGLSDKVTWLRTPPAAKALGEIGSPEGARFPSCYRRLWVFSEEARVLGERILCLDLDFVLTGNMDQVVDRDEDFVGWRPFRDWGKKLRFGGGQYLLRTGSRTHVWNGFKGAESIAAARSAGFRGSDQAWLSYCLAGREPYWDNDTGLYSVRDLGPGLDLPGDACLVQFNGRDKPWDVARRGRPQWVVDHWR